MLCSKVSQKFNTQFRYEAEMIPKWFLKRKSEIFNNFLLPNFQKFFFSKKKKSENDFYFFHFILAPEIYLQNVSPHSSSQKKKKKTNLLNEEKKKTWTFTRWITVSSVWKRRVRGRIHEIDGPIWNHSTPRAVGCSRKTQGAKGVVGKHRDVQGQRGRRGLVHPIKQCSHICQPLLLPLPFEPPPQVPNYTAPFAPRAANSAILCVCIMRPDHLGTHGVKGRCPRWKRERTTVKTRI